MDLLEYQGKQYFARYGIPVSPGGVAVTPDEAVELAESLGYPVVVKAQVQVGGRGKAGGIKLAANTAEGRRSRHGHPRDGHQGPLGAPCMGRACLRHCQGVLRQLHARPGRQGAPRDGLSQRRRRHRRGGHRGPGRHRPSPRRSLRRFQRGPGLAIWSKRQPSTRRRGRARSTCCSTFTAVSWKATPTWSR